MTETADARWLLLIHQIPPKPGYFRVKIWRRLQRLGAVAIKGSVWALPRTEGTLEDFQWILREIVQGGGDASLIEARFIDGIDDDQVIALFHAARDADYARILSETEALLGKRRKRLDEEERQDLVTDVGRLRRALEEVEALDFFHAPGRDAAQQALASIDARLAPPVREGNAGRPRPEMRGRTWVTRKGIHIDRMASAWLIRRFIDPDARFKFVPPRGYKPAAGERRFDMFDAEYTHEGDGCTFETLIARFGLGDVGLAAIAEIVHDLDLKDGKFGRDDAPGVERLVAGIALAHRDDEARLERASAVLDDLYAYFRRRQSEVKP
jgi:hypothetical protein